MSPHDALLDVLRAVRSLLAQPHNNFAWSSWDDATEALTEIDGLIARVASGTLPPRPDVELLFAPTGAIQEVSLSSGWGDDFLELATRFDAACAATYRH